MADKDYAIVLMEQMRDELRAVHEAVAESLR